MRLDTLQGERNLSELTRRLFQINERSTRRHKELAQRAEAALLEANPHLADIRTLDAGTLVVVPEVEGVQVVPATTAAASASDINQQDLAEQLRQTLNTARNAVEASLTRETEEARNMMKEIEDRGLRELARRSPELQEHLSRIAEQGKARLRDIEAQRASRKQDFAQLEKDISGFIRLFAER